MPTLQQSLEGKDFGHLAIVAELWGLEFNAKGVREAIDQLSDSILDSELIDEVVTTLPAEAQSALRELQEAGGRMRWEGFKRSYGELRELGAAKRDKEKVHRNPISTSELLWYRALLGRAFFDLEKKTTEYAYIPEDILKLLRFPAERENKLMGRLARPKERKVVRPASDSILDESCTLLAGLRIGMGEEELLEAAEWKMAPQVLMEILSAAGILDEGHSPKAEAVQAFLTAERGKAMAQLSSAWLKSDALNELKLMPGLKAQGSWQNDAKHTRNLLLQILRKSSGGKWWSISALMDDMKRQMPDFQRQGGEYDSWYLQDEESGNYLRGFEAWEQVEGAMLRFLIGGMMHWLGIVELGYAKEGGEASAFRFSKWADDLLEGKAPQGLSSEEDKLKIDSQGLIQASNDTARAIRYQIARYCEWERPKAGFLRYRIGARALERAKNADLELAKFITLLERNSSNKLPPNLLEALRRWEKEGTQAKMSEMLVLRVSSEAIIKALKKSRGGRYLGAALGPFAIEVKAGAKGNVLQVLSELGYLGEIEEKKDA